MEETPLLIKPANKILIVPSVLAGVFLGINNFLLASVSNSGISALFVFSLGAIVFPFIAKSYGGGRSSGLYNIENHLVKPSWIKLTGLFLRSILNIMVQVCIMCGFYFAHKAGVASGVMTSMYSMHVLFIQFFSYFIFNE